jgi:hypothetical protein
VLKVKQKLLSSGLIVLALLYPVLGLSIDKAVSPGQLCSSKLLEEALSLPPEFERARHDGYFFPAADEVKERVLHAFTHHAAKLKPSQIRRVELNEIKTTISGLNEEALQRADTEFAATPLPGVAPLVELIKPFGFTGFSSVYYNPSAAGNWRRGGRLVKLLFPFNAAQILSEEKWAMASALMEFLAADDKDRVALFQKAKAEKRSWVEGIDHVGSVDDFQIALEQLIEEAQNNPDAFSPREFKFAQIALESVRTGKYIHFDLLTSRSTHDVVRGGIRKFKESFRDWNFSSDPQENAEIHDALNRYFLASEALRETHLVGYQEEVLPMSPKTKQYLTGEEANGIGAGTVWKTQTVTGRAQQLMARGVRYGVFQNVEVLSFDLRAEFAAYLATGKAVGVVLVPALPGDKGGAAYWIRQADGNWEMQMVEECALPNDDYASGNETFNANTIFYPLGSQGPDTIDFERRPSRTGEPMLVAKVSAASVTFVQPWGAILGERGTSYQALKKAPDYHAHGGNIVKGFQAVLSRLVQRRP